MSSRPFAYWALVLYAAALALSIGAMAVALPSVYINLLGGLSTIHERDELQSVFVTLSGMTLMILIGCCALFSEWHRVRYTKSHKRLSLPRSIFYHIACIGGIMAAGYISHFGGVLLSHAPILAEISAELYAIIVLLLIGIRYVLDALQGGR